MNKLDKKVIAPEHIERTMKELENRVTEFYSSDKKLLLKINGFGDIVALEILEEVDNSYLEVEIVKLINDSTKAVKLAVVQAFNEIANIENKDNKEEEEHYVS